MPDDKGHYTPTDWLEFAKAIMPLLMMILELFKMLPQAKQVAVINKAADMVAPTIPS